MFKCKEGRLATSKKEHERATYRMHMNINSKER